MLRLPGSISMNKRTTFSYIGEILRERMPLEQSWYRAEKLPSFLPFFVRRDVLQQLRNNANELICGRRGTGKTHLLGAFKELVRDASPSAREMCVILSASDFGGTPPTVIDETIEFARRRYSRLIFREFLRQFVEKFITESDRYYDAIVPTADGAAISRHRKRLSDMQFALYELVYSGTPYSDHDTYETTTKEHKATTQHGKLNASIAADTSKGVQGQLAIGANISRQVDANRDAVLHQEGIMWPDLQRIRDIARQIVELLGGQVLYILIDEWMELDKNLNLEIQPYVIQLIKQVFFGDRRFAVKIASVWHSTDLYERSDLSRSRGVQLGQDIRIAVDLDTARMTDDNDIVTFYKEMLFHRIQYSVTDVHQYKVGDNIDDRFIIEFFDSIDNFKTLIAASNGLPRAFWELFDKCNARIKRDFKTLCIDRALIRECAQAIFLTERRRSLDKESRAHQLWSQINGVLDRTGHPLILVSPRQARTSKALAKLVDDEFLHPIPSAFLPRAIRDKLKPYLIDYGNIVDWEATNPHRVLTHVVGQVLPPLPPDLENCFDAFVIDPTVADEAWKRCDHCKKEFPKSQPVFLKHGLCPLCGDPTDDDGPSVEIKADFSNKDATEISRQDGS